MHLYQFPLLEQESLDMSNETLLEQVRNKWQVQAQVRSASKVFQQVLTHQVVNARFWELEVKETPVNGMEGYVLVSKMELNKYAFPKVIDRYLGDRTLVLNLL